MLVTDVSICAPFPVARRGRRRGFRKAPANQCWPAQPWRLTKVLTLLGFSLRQVCFDESIIPIPMQTRVGYDDGGASHECDKEHWDARSTRADTFCDTLQIHGPRRFEGPQDATNTETRGARLTSITTGVATFPTSAPATTPAPRPA